ncbi:glycoside hydrolase TIM-barrel-like domain-containing protein [Wolbachia endosymbiont of Delia radicum]|uniref:glycoside hydrolase/phage tail family protein n=1 Tax=unclassified Wolbachia TaxID=2640676 RepID=UPI001F32239C|nr:MULTISPECIES: glycoside hydrolase TIM-barrel-like domain-containing protein [unclassified Wolbachia]UJQ21281.1 glycoside hydrolase TIM-barrel-like domain-containing protein [Wolbachia endosymbiont of Delia radicum]
MSTIILSSIFGQAGSIFGPIGRIIGSELGALLGSQLDGAMFGLDAEQKVTHGARLKNLQVQTSTYGRTIPIIYGTARVAGNIIWSQPIKEEAITTKSKIGRGMNVTYNYYATLAIAICKGKVEKLNRIWADTTSLSFDEIDYTFYSGREDQNPDPFMSSIEGEGNVPAYRGISYIVIKNFPLADYNNHVPVFTFEVQTAVKSNEFSVAKNIRNINIIPGSGEFVYDTKIQKKIAQEKISSNQYIPYGLAQRVNHNNHTKKSDAMLSLDQLKGDLPNVEWVSVVVNWFVNDLNIKDCKIYPAVEFQDDSAILPDDWQVGGVTRDNAQLISKDASGNPRYGGTVSDAALIRYIEELHSRGYKVMLYPMPLLDTKNKEWRGRLSGTPEDISDFFKNQYNKFIEHYASIAKQTKVEGFIIGSEFAQLTKIRDEQGNYPAVIELVKLAKQIKLNLGKEVTVTYAADWSEYHSYDGWYNMDELWSSEYIDVVGIDAYFPLTDGPEPPFGYSAEDVMGGWSSGVGYDYFYDYSKGEPERVKYNDSRYAWKNIAKWWSETHINPGGSKTKWQPKMKKIWFTEYGFPSMNGCTNEPNVFVDKGSIESKYPRYSNGEVSFLSQKIAIEGTLKKWQSSEMVEKMFLWAWDARPFPYFPNLCDVWADCHNWQTGHWIQGKLSQLNISDVLSDLLQKTGLKSDQFDTSNVKGLLSGYVINDQQSVRSIIKMLQSCYFFDVVEQDSKLKFVQKGRGVTTGIPIGEMVFSNNSKLANISQLDLNNKVNVVYFNRNFGYPIDVKYAELPKQGAAITVEIPLIMEEGEAQNIAEVLLYSSWQERNIYNFKLPIKYAWLVPSDVITILDGEKKHTVRIIKTKFESMSIQVIGVGYDHSIYKLSFPSTRSLMLKEYPPSHISKTIVEMIDLPDIKGNSASFTLISEEKNWKGATLFISYNDKDYKPIASTNKQSTYGYVMESTDEGLIVVLRFGNITSIADSNLALVGKEIVKFQNAELIDKNKYKLSNLIRGQEGTKEYQHTAGEKFVLLDDSIISFEVQRGKKFYLKAVTYGDSLENTEVKVINSFSN